MCHQCLISLHGSSDPSLFICVGQSTPCVVDGVVDSDNFPDKSNVICPLEVHVFYPCYIALWSNYLLDTDKSMESFYTGCADAGHASDRCAFWAPSPDDICQNLTKLYDSISVQPIPVKIGNTYCYVDLQMLHYLWAYVSPYLHPI